TYRRKRNGRRRNETLRKTAASSGAESATSTRSMLSDIRRSLYDAQDTAPLKVPRVPGRPTAVHRQDVAIHVAVFWIGQEQGSNGNFVRRGGATERDVVEHALHVVAKLAPFAVE